MSGKINDGDSVEPKDEMDGKSENKSMSNDYKGGDCVGDVPEGGKRHKGNVRGEKGSWHGFKKA